MKAKSKGRGECQKEMRSWDHWMGHFFVLCSSVFVCVCVGAKINFAFACRRRSSITRCGGRSFGLGDIWDCTPFWNWTGSGSFGCLWWDVAWSFSLSPLPMHLRQPLAGAAWGPAAAPDCYQYPPATPNDLEPFWGSLKDSALKSNNNSGTGDGPGNNFEYHSAWFPPCLEFKLLKVAAALRGERQGGVSGAEGA